MSALNRFLIGFPRPGQNIMQPNEHSPLSNCRTASYKAVVVTNLFFLQTDISRLLMLGTMPTGLCMDELMADDSQIRRQRLTKSEDGIVT